MKKQYIKKMQKKVIKKIDNEVNICKLKSKKQILVSLVFLLICAIWILGHFTSWKHIPGCLYMYYVGIIFEYLIPAVFTSIVLYIFINWLPEKKQNKMYIHNVYAITEDKPLVGASLLESLYNSMKDFMLEFIEIEKSTVSNDHTALYIKNYTFDQIHTFLKCNKISYSKDTIEDMENAINKMESTKDLNIKLYDLIKQDAYKSTLMRLDELAYKTANFANELLNEGVVESNNEISYLLRGVRSCNLSVWSHYGNWMEMELGKFHLVKSDQLNTCDISKMITQDFSFLSTELYRLYKYYRVLYQYIYYYNIDTLYRNSTEQLIRKKMNS